MAYFAIAVSVLLTVTGQLLVKWRVSILGVFPTDHTTQISYFASILSDPFIWLGLACAFGAFLSWVVAVSDLDLSYAYPFMASTYGLILVASALLFQEPVSLPKISGVLLIMTGIAVTGFWG